MRITNACTNCGGCVPFCPQGAITQGVGEHPAQIDANRCVECGVCLDSVSCPRGAVAETTGPEEEIKKRFGRMLTVNVDRPKTKGRTGKQDVKRCDARGGLPTQTVAVRLELGRVAGSPCLAQVEAVRQSLLHAGFAVEPQSAYAALLQGTPATLPESLGHIRILSTSFECEIAPGDLPGLLDTAEAAAVGQAVSLAANALLHPNLLSKVQSCLAAVSRKIGPNGKINLGLAKAGKGEATV